MSPKYPSGSNASQEEKLLWDSIKTEQFKRVYLITGTEQYLKQKYANLLLERVVPAGLEAFNVHQLKGEDTSVQEIADCVEMLPVMSPRTCVFVHDFPLKELTETEQNQLLEVLSDLPETCVLVFWQDTAEVGSTAKSKELLNAFKKAGMVSMLSTRSDDDLVKFIISECKKWGSSIDYSTARYFLEYVGTDMANLQNEIGKVCNYAGAVVQKEHIEALAVQSLETTAFKMTDAIAAGNFDAAYWSLTILFDTKTDPTMILGAMVSGYVDLYRAKVGKQAGRTAAEVTELFPGTYKGKDFRMKKAYQRCGRYSMSSLRNCLDILARADRKLKTRFDDSKLVFEQLFIELWEAGKTLC